MRHKRDSDRVRVLFLSDHFGYAGGVIHGATRYFLAVLPRLRSHGIDLTIAFLRGDHPASAQLRELGLEPHFFGRAKWSLMPILDVLRTIRRDKIQLIHASGMKGILTARIAGMIASVPVISHLHDQMPFSAALAKLIRWTAGWSTHTLAVSREVALFADKSLRIDPSRTEVLTNGLAADEIRKTPVEAGLKFREQVGVSPDMKLIGVVGRLIPVKGHEILLRAMPAILEKEPSARLLIIGDGPERSQLESRVCELGLSGYVFFTGNVTDVYAALRALDVCAIPSLNEGLPYSLLEALAIGKPVVASAVGGLAEALRHCENGVLVRPNDAQALAQALHSVLTDPLLAETIVHGGSETIRAFDITSHIDRLIIIYGALAAGESVPPRSQDAMIQSRQSVTSSIQPTHNLGRLLSK